MANPSASSESGVRFRIGQVARITGLSPHTIRVWERRYGTVHPHRSAGGDRLYSEAELARLQLLVRLQKMGYAIGTIARLPLEELERMGQAVRVLSASAPSPETPGPPLSRLVEEVLAAIERLDMPEAERLLARATAALDSHALVFELYVPMLHRVGQYWDEKRWNVAQEHAASALFRTQVSALMHARPSGSMRGHVVATTLPGELHEFGALLATIVAGALGWEAVYLGPNLPVGELVEAVHRVRPEVVLVSSVCAEPSSVRAHLRALRAAIPSQVRLVAGGAAAQPVKGQVRGLDVVPSLRDLSEVLS